MVLQWVAESYSRLHHRNITRGNHIPYTRIHADRVPNAKIDDLDPAHLQVPLTIRLTLLARIIHNRPATLKMSTQDAKIASLVSRFNEPTASSSASRADMDDEDIFAELEAEIENDSSAVFRERGMDRLKAE